MLAKLGALLFGLVLAAAPALADMYQDASNAKLPDARTNLHFAPIMATDIGFKGDGTTDNSAALAAMLARTDSATIYFPSGTYMVGCPPGSTAQSAISIEGAGVAASIIKFNPGCTLSSDIRFYWDGRSGVRISNITFDQNNPSELSSNGPLIGIFSYIGNVNGASIDHVNIINSPNNQYVTMFASCCGYVFENGHMDDNYIHTTTPAYYPNQCLSATTVNRSGVMRYMSMDRNICVNSAIQADGDYYSVSYNDISGFAFGTGIFAPFASSSYYTIIGNRIHDSGAAQRDTSGISVGGIEVPHNSIVCDNMFWNLGGAAIVNFGKDNLLCNNIAWNNSNLADSASPPPSWLDQAAYVTPLYGGSKSGQNARWVGNKAYDDRGAGAKQIYGYLDISGDAVPGISFSGNDFKGYKTGKAYAIGMGTNPDPNPVVMSDWVTLGPRLIIYRAPSIEFTNIDPSFTQYRIVCSGLGPYLAGTLKMQFGYGTGPTWITGVNYTSGGSFVNLANTTPTVYADDSNGMKLTPTTWGVKYGPINQNLMTAQFGTLWIAGSDALSMNFKASYAAATGFQETASGVGVTQLTANPITAIRILSEDAGAVSGICLLQGML